MRREPQPQFNSNPHNKIDMSFCLYISIYRHSVTRVGSRHQCTFVNMSWGKRYLNSTSVVSCVMSLCMWYRLWWILWCRYGKWFHFLAGKHLHEQHSRAYLDSKDALYERCAQDSSLIPRLSGAWTNCIHKELGGAWNKAKVNMYPSLVSYYTHVYQYTSVSHHYHHIRCVTMYKVLTGVSV